MNMNFDWASDAKLASNFATLAISIAQQPTDEEKQELSRGYSSLSARLNAIANVKWALVKSDDRCVKYIALKAFQLKFTQLPIEHPKKITLHLDSAIKIIERTLNESEQQYIQKKIALINSSKEQAVIAESIAKLNRIIKGKNILSNQDKKSFTVMVANIKSKIGTDSELLSTITQIENRIIQLPVIPMKNNSLILGPRAAINEQNLSIANVSNIERTLFDGGNGIALSLSAMQNSVKAYQEQISTSIKAIKNALPLFRRIKQTEHCNNYVLHKTSIGNVKAFSGQFTFDGKSDKQLAKLAIKIAKQSNWTRIEAWGSEEFRVYLSAFSKKENIEVKLLSNSQIKFIKATIETDTSNAIRVNAKKIKAAKGLSSQIHSIATPSLAEITSSSVNLLAR
jgi:hypothetical protein